jgi:hypothetical protein
MGRRRQVVIEEPETAQIEEQIAEEKKIKEQIEIQEWVSEFQSRFTEQPYNVLIEKFDNGEWSICRRYSLNTFDHEAIRAEFGGGKYRAVLIDPRGRYVPEGRNTFKFAESLIKPELLKPAPNPLENPAIALMIESMRANQTNLMELMKVIVAGNPGSQKSDLAQIIGAMKGIQELTPKDKPLDSIKDTLGLMKLVKDVSGEGDSKGGFLSELKQFMEVWPAIKEQMASAKGAPVPLAPAPNAAPSPTPVPIERTPTVMDPLTAKIVQLVPKFVKAAKEAQPIPGWGATLLDIVDVEIMPLLVPVWKKQYGPLVQNEDDAFDILVRYAKDPAEREKIFKTITPLDPYKEWVNNVILEAVRLCELDPEASDANVVVHAVAGNGQAIAE